MAQIPYEHVTGSTPTLPGLRAWLRNLLAARHRRAAERRPRQGDLPTRYTDAEIREMRDRERARWQAADDAMAQLALRAGLWGRY